MVILCSSNTKVKLIHFFFGKKKNAYEKIFGTSDALPNWNGTFGWNDNKKWEEKTRKFSIILIVEIYFMNYTIFTCCGACSVKLNVGCVFIEKLKPPTFGGSLDGGFAFMLLLPVPN